MALLNDRFGSTGQPNPNQLVTKETDPMPVLDSRSNSNVIFEREGLLKRVGGNENFVEKLIEAFFSDALLLAEQLQSAITAGNHEESRRLSHKLGGSAANMGFVAFSSVAREMELLSQAENVSALSEKTSELEKQFLLARQTALKQL
jgi:HPt (histidine-containing phosphotransfer) domain-containing protein